MPTLYCTIVVLVLMVFALSLLATTSAETKTLDFPILGTAVVVSALALWSLFSSLPA